MVTSVLSTVTHHPTAHLQIKYVSRLPDTRTSSPFFGASNTRTRNTSLSNSPLISATVTDNTSAKSWAISTTLRNISSTPQSQSVKIYAWPMFEPDQSQFVASGSTQTAVAASQAGKVEVVVPKRDLACFDERKGKWILEEGIYMFEIKASDDLRAGMSVVKQVSVVGNMVWDE